MVKGYVGVQREKGWKGGMGGPDFMTVEGPGFSLSGPGYYGWDFLTSEAQAPKIRLANKNLAPPCVFY